MNGSLEIKIINPTFGSVAVQSLAENLMIALENQKLFLYEKLDTLVTYLWIWGVMTLLNLNCRIPIFVLICGTLCSCILETGFQAT
jgi:hypothetical protein